MCVCYGPRSLKNGHAFKGKTCVLLVCSFFDHDVTQLNTPAGDNEYLCALKCNFKKICMAFS